MTSFLELAIKVFKLDEGDGVPGHEGEPYMDTAGFWTIGRGHLIGENLSDLKLPPEIIEALFQIDLAEAVKEARLTLGNQFFNSLPLARQMAFTSMLFTLGRAKFLKFDETIALAKRGDWDAVAMHILDSKWARDVDPKQREGIGRDDRVAYMFKTGRFHPDYRIVEDLL